MFKYTPLHYWIMSSVAMIWSLLGAADYLLTQYNNDLYLAQFSIDQVVFFTNMPFMAQLGWGFAV